MAPIMVGGSILMGKVKYIFVALKVAKFGPLASMVISSFAYSFIFGPAYAVGMVGLIFCHECGHAIVMRYYNIPFSPMVFVPFMGAVIVMKDKPKNAFQDAMVAFGGPVLGTVSAAVVATAAMTTNSQLLHALADWGYLINLFNLLPIGSMDGGRIGNAISPHIGALGVTAGGAMIYYNAVSNPIFYLIMLGGTYTTASRYFGWDKEDPSYYQIPPSQQTGLFGGYVGLIATLLLLKAQNDKSRLTPRQLEAQAAGHTVSVDNQKDDGVYDDYFPDLNKYYGFTDNDDDERGKE